MKQRLAQLQQRYAALEPRERRIVLIGGAVLLVVVYFLAVWEPLSSARAAAADRIASERSLAMRLARAEAELGQRPDQSRAAPDAGRTRSLLAVVDQTGKAAGLGNGIRRVQPDGDDRVRVWLEDVPFDNTIRWLDRLQRREGLTVETADISADSKPGTVEARLGLTR